MVSSTLWFSPWITDSFLLALARPGLFAPSRTPAMHSERSRNSWKPFVNMHNVLQVTGLLSVLSMVWWRNLSPCVKKMHYQDWKERVVACVTMKKGQAVSFQTNSYLEEHFLIFLLQTKHLAQTLHIDSHICCCVLPICLFHFTFSQGSTKGILDRWLFWEKKCIFNQLIGESFLCLIHCESRKSGGTNFSLERAFPQFSPKRNTTVLSEFFTKHHN